MKKKSLKNLRYAFLATVSTLALTASLGSFNYRGHSAFNDNFSNLTPALNKVDSSVKTIAFQTDTFDTYKSTLLLHVGHDIYRYFSIGSKAHQMQLPLFAHEDRHEHNTKIKYWEKTPYSPSEFIQLRMHEEISANVAAILTAELEYRVSENKEDVIKKYENTYMEFYFKAIRNHEINPESTKQEDLDKKYSLLVNGAIKMWEETYARHYTPALFSRLNTYLSCYGFHRPHPNNYKKVLSHMYNFGGVDLSKYITQDAHFSDVSLDIFNELYRFTHLRKHFSLRSTLVEDIEKKLPYILNTFTSSEQRIAAFQHLFIASEMKYQINQRLKNSDEISSSTISAIYNKTLHKLSSDIEFSQIVMNCAQKISPTKIFNSTILPASNSLDFRYFLTDPIFNEEDMAKIQKLYTLNNKDFSSYIKNFDANILPIDKNFSFNFIFHSDIYQKDFSCAETSANHSQLIIEDKAFTKDLASQTSDNNTKKAPRRSDTLYINIPDFEQVIFQPHALTAKGWQQLTELYKSFDEIPEVLKSCRLDEIVEYMQKHNNPQYFVSKSDPFKPVYKTQKATSPKNKPLGKNLQSKKNKVNLARRQFHKQR